MDRKIATRRHAREWAVQMLVAADVNPQDCGTEEFISSMWDMVDDPGAGVEAATAPAESGAAESKEAARAAKKRRDMHDFAAAIVSGVLSSVDEIDGILGGLLDKWDISRLGTIERAVLRMGVWEMKYGKTPAPVAINEAIDIANWFSGPKTRAIVNGVLDKYAKSPT